MDRLRRLVEGSHEDPIATFQFLLVLVKVHIYQVGNVFLIVLRRIWDVFVKDLLYVQHSSESTGVDLGSVLLCNPLFQSDFFSAGGTFRWASGHLDCVCCPVDVWVVFL